MWHCRARAKKLVRQFNALPPGDMDGRAALLPKLFREVGENSVIGAGVSRDIGYSKCDSLRQSL